MATPQDTSADRGLFGPDSVTWRVHADPILTMGGLRALLLQAVHPLAMAGVAQHSNYDGDPWGRLMRTAAFVGVTSYGTTDEARRATARVRAMHARLSGIEPESGVAYRVSDPKLLTWVHVVEVESFWTTYRRAGGPAAPGDADRYYGEQQQIAALLGAPDVPTTQAGIYDYLRDMRPELRVTSEARDAAKVVLSPPMPGWVSFATPAKAAWLGLGLTAFALLPRWARRLYHLPGLPITDVAASVTTRALRRTLLTIPADVREGPSLKAARARLS